MEDESLAKVLDVMEGRIGKERMSALRRQAAKEGVSVLNLLSRVVTKYVRQIEEGSAPKAQASS